MTYEEVIEKYAREKFNCAPTDKVEHVSIDSYTYDAWGCPTCGPAFETNIDLYATINKQYRSIKIGTDFIEVLREILEVQ